MDMERLFGPDGLAMKGLQLAMSLAQQGKDVAPVIRSLTNVFSKRSEDVTDEELDQVEADLDKAQDEFERPMQKLR